MTENSLAGKLAVSRAGNDKGRLYLIIKEEPPYLLLTDGKHRKKEAPKKKKRKHVGVILHLPEAVREYKSDKQEELTDADIRRIIRLYEKTKQESKMIQEEN